MEEMRNAYKIIAVKPERWRPLGRPRSRWEDTIKMDLGKVRSKAVDWINLPQDRGGGLLWTR
jgi:hypothetical protein